MREWEVVDGLMGYIESVGYENLRGVRGGILILPSLFYLEEPLDLLHSGRVAEWIMRIEVRSKLGVLHDIREGLRVSI